MQSLELLDIFITPLEKSQIPYFVTGSIASIFYGEPRLTHDIDVVVHLSKADFSKIPISFPFENYYCPPEEVIQIENNRKPYGHFNLIHHESGFKADIYTDIDDELHNWAFKNRKRIEVLGLSLWIAPPEYVIIRKLEFFREGRSEKHLIDIQKMLSQIINDLDLDFLEKQITQRRLVEIWDKVIAKEKN